MSSSSSPNKMPRASAIPADLARNPGLDGSKAARERGTDGGPDPRWYEFSVGRWDGDYTFIVDTLGIDDTPWLDRAGHPRSSDLTVEEKYTRDDRDAHFGEWLVTNHQIRRAYTMPYDAAKVVYKWNPVQATGREQLCVPSVMAKYLSIIGNPADPNASARRQSKLNSSDKGKRRTTWRARKQTRRRWKWPTA